MLGARALAPVADHHEPRADSSLPHARENLHAVYGALHRPEVRDVYEQRLARRSEFTTQLLARSPLVVRRADEVRDDGDVVELESLSRRLLEIMRDRRDSVRLRDAVTRDGKIRAVGPDERDVRAVQRRDDGKDAVRLQRLAREDGAYRVRDGVVYVQEV